MRRVAAAAVGLVALAAPASARAELVERVSAATPVTVFGSYAAWSRYDPSTKRFRLVIWHDGRARLAPIASRRASFDADLGMGSNGRVTAVYSRCDRIFGPTRGELPIRAYDKGCSLYAYDVRRRRERRLAAPSRAAGSEILPSLSRGRLVFARVAPARATPRLPLLISARLGEYRERRLPRPSGWASPVVLGDNLGPVAIDVAGDCHATIDTPTGFGFTSPGLAGSALRYAFYSGPESRVRLAEVDLATGARTAADLPAAGSRLLLSTQTGSGWTWIATDEVVGGRHTTAIHRERIVLTPR